MADDNLTVEINGQVYEGWKSARVSRSLDHCAADFDLTVTERWAVGGTGDAPWQIKPFDACTVSAGGEPLITGFVDYYGPGFDAMSHGVRIAGRSKTEDIIDCMPDIPGGQYDNYKLDKIAKAVCGPFGISVVVAAGTDLGEPFPNATIQKSETAFEFIDKLCGLRGVLAFDDEKGNLVLAQAGAAGSAGALIQGENILAATGSLSADKRYQKYVVLAQAPLAFDGQEAQLEVIGTATDSGVPRFRRYVEMAQDPADTARAKLRALWRAAHNFGEATQATITVQGWRQAGGDIWKVNQLVTVTCPYLQLDQQLLIGRISLILDDKGRRTELLVAPPEAFAPAPPKAKNPKGKSSFLWTASIQ